MKHRILSLIVALITCLSAFSQSSYYLDKARSYMRDAEYYISKAEGYDREAEYHTKKAKEYQREVDYYTRNKQTRLAPINARQMTRPIKLVSSNIGPSKQKKTPELI